jgi:hypothetical protein
MVLCIVRTDRCFPDDTATASYVLPAVGGEVAYIDM